LIKYSTPLRYPGGKQRFAPFIADLLQTNDLLGGHYVEPYAGGAGVAMFLLLSGKVEHVYLNDASPALYAFWRSIQRDPDEFCRRIAGASLTVEEWRRQKFIVANRKQFTQMDVGFGFFFLNRCTRSGIPNGGLIGGVKQQGQWRMDARFYRTELIRRVEAIALRRKQMTVTNLDAEEFIKSRIPKLPKRTLVYCDPPYFHRAHRLYLNYYQPDDHIELAKTIQRHLKRPWLVSYDNVPDVRKCYSDRRSFFYNIQYSAAQSYIGTEIFFVSDDLKVPLRRSGRPSEIVLMKTK
jgi:DNA adenine methylase